MTQSIAASDNRPPSRFQAQPRTSDRVATATVVVPSSWGPDDDFELLLSAIDELERLIARADVGRDVHVVLTGLGPLREPLLGNIIWAAQGQGAFFNGWWWWPIEPAVAMILILVRSF